MKILLIDGCHANLEKGVLQLGHQLVEAKLLTADEIIQFHSDAEGFLVRARLSFQSEFLSQFPKLRFIARFGSGMEHIDIEWAEANGIRCLSAPEGNRDAVGEHALGMLLSLFNNLNRADYEVRKGVWQRESNRGIELTGKTVGIIGYGNMGSSFAHKLRGFNLKILVHDKYRSNFGHNWIEEVELDRIKDEADIISIHLPLNQETAEYLNIQFFQELKNPVYIINTSRGNQLVLKDLWKAMESGIVKGACLDVLEYESSSFENALLNDDALVQNLLSSDRIIFSPHIAGWTHESQLKMAQLLLEKISNFDN
jgi:D-3-phosphoglycerate dehydrogenase